MERDTILRLGQTGGGCGWHSDRGTQNREWKRDRLPTVVRATVRPNNRRVSKTDLTGNGLQERVLGFRLFVAFSRERGQTGGGNG
jgi:hypothetical protein